MDWFVHFKYSPETEGGLTWVREAANRRMKVGDTAGRPDNKGYWAVGLGKGRYRNHRIIWEMFNGQIPEGIQVDHIDGNRANNRIENLRLVTNMINCYNQKKKCTNTSGVNGVCLTDNGSGKLYWCASWNFEGKRCGRMFALAKYGNELAFELAVKTRKEAEEMLKLNGIDVTERHGK